MAFVRWPRAGLLLPFIVGALCAACGGDSDEEEEQQQDPGGGGREGPAGCYIIGEMRCDCEIEEAACTGAGTQQWVDEGCQSCAM